MTIVKQSRTQLDKALGLPTGVNETVDPLSRANIVLLISGAEDSPSRDIHDKAVDKISEPWRKTFLITDLSILTPAERTKWVGSDGRYAVYRVNGPKAGPRGNIADLQLNSGGPSIMKIKSAFRRGKLA